MTDKAKLAAALRQLDTTKDAHWTADGKPKLETIRLLSGIPSLGRDDLDAAYPAFSRTNSTIPADEPAAAPTPTQTSGSASGGTAGTSTDVQAAENLAKDNKTPESAVALHNLETVAKQEGTFVHEGRDASGNLINGVVTGTESQPPAPPGIDIAALQPAPSPADEVVSDEARMQGLRDQIADMDEDIEAGVKAKVDIERRMLEIQNRRDALVMELEGMQVTSDPMQAYKKSVIDQKQRRADANREFGPVARALASQLSGPDAIDNAISQTTRRANAENAAKQRSDLK